MIDLDVDLDGLRLHELEDYTCEAKQEIRRLRAVNAELAEACRRAREDLEADRNRRSTRDLLANALAAAEAAAVRVIP